MLISCALLLLSSLCAWILNATCQIDFALVLALLLSCLQLAVFFCLLLAMLFCLLLAMLFSVLFIISPLLDVERCSASESSLRCSSRCPCTCVASLSSFHHWLVGCCSASDFHHLLLGCGSVSDLLQRHFVVGYIFLDASPAPPTPLLGIAHFVIVGSR